MRFRGVMSDYSAMKDFMNIVHSLSKLSKECILRILPNNVYFIIAEEDNGPRRPFIWCELINSYFFREYEMIGVSNEANEIFLSFSPVMLSKSVTSIKMGAKSLTMKLTDKQTPCLTLKIDMAVGEITQNRLCVHDIPVEIIPRKHWAAYKEPKFQEFHVTLQMPAMKSVRNIVDRMKSMSHYLIVSAKKSGRVTLKIETNLVTFSAHFPNLTIESFMDVHDEDDGDSTCLDSEDVTACIDIRKFVSFLTALYVTNTKFVCSIVNGKMVKLLLENSGVMSLQCFLTQVSQ